MATVIGGILFLSAGFASYILAGEVYTSLSMIWNALAKPALYSFALTVIGSVLFVWGMGWTMKTKDRKKMQEYRKLQREKRKKQRELERKKLRLLKKHGLANDAK